MIRFIGLLLTGEPDPLTRRESVFVYSCLILCTLILLSACLYLGYKIGALIS